MAKMGSTKPFLLLLGFAVLVVINASIYAIASADIRNNQNAKTANVTPIENQTLPTSLPIKTINGTETQQTTNGPSVSAISLPTTQTIKIGQYIIGRFNKTKRSTLEEHQTDKLDQTKLLENKKHIQKIPSRRASSKTNSNKTGSRKVTTNKPASLKAEYGRNNTKQIKNVENQPSKNKANENINFPKLEETATVKTFFLTERLSREHFGLDNFRTEKMDKILVKRDKNSKVEVLNKNEKQTTVNGKKEKPAESKKQNKTEVTQKPKNITTATENDKRNKTVTAGPRKNNDTIAVKYESKAGLSNKTEINKKEQKEEKEYKTTSKGEDKNKTASSNENTKNVTIEMILEQAENEAKKNEEKTENDISVKPIIDNKNETTQNILNSTGNSNKTVGGKKEENASTERTLAVPGDLRKYDTTNWPKDLRDQVPFFLKYFDLMKSAYQQLPYVPPEYATDYPFLVRNGNPHVKAFYSQIRNVTRHVNNTSF